MRNYDTGTLIALQVGIYRYTEAVDLASKIVDRATNAVRTVLQGGGHLGACVLRSRAMSERVLIAMSGGVDSSVAAARLCAQGYDVVGVTLHLWDYPDDGSVKSRCCAPEDVHDARRVADLLGIPHYAFDRRELFQREVVAPFVESYLEGETPSPCVRCNRGVKIRELFQLADRLSAARVATGHYARVLQNGAHFELLSRTRSRQRSELFSAHARARRALAG